MNSVLLGLEEEPGFSFRNYQRNENLFKDGFKQAHPIKSGTTIVGLVFKDGVVLGADSRASAGQTIVSRDCEKLYYIQDNIFCCAAGRVADMQMTTGFVSNWLELIRRNTNRKFVPVIAAAQISRQYLFRYQGKINNELIYGGVDHDGPQVYQVHSHGSVSCEQYTTTGSGGLAAMAVFETCWRPNMEEDSAVKLVRDAIVSGIFNDLGSGSNVDICVIRKNSHKIIRGYEEVQTQGIKALDYTPKRGTTKVLYTKKFDIEIVEEEKMIIDDDE